MLVNAKAHTTLHYDPLQQWVEIIDQTLLPHRFATITLQTLPDFCNAISVMQVRGAPLIGATAAFGLALALEVDPSSSHEADAAAQLLATRPTAINLRWALDRVRASISNVDTANKATIALQTAEAIRAEDIAFCEAIGEHGLTLLRQLKPKQQRLNILTHCNAGWLATIDWGTALAPIYKAHQAGIDVHVWVDETRPRNQGASLTAWELQQQGIAHTVIADNTGGHLMQQGLVDVCLIGSDRTTASGDVCNKIGSYLKALAAKDNGIPFYVALPSSSIDWDIDDGLRQIPIEQRSARELTHIQGLDSDGEIREVQLFANSPAANYAFDVTPAVLVSGLITERGIFAATPASLGQLKQQLLEA
ncbi:MAG: methylthioribose-1-phosphate isomerase [Oceanicoccus sp.]|jgi:methylthioribose-1-phosphate isomerase